MENSIITINELGKIRMNPRSGAESIPVDEYNAKIIENPEKHYSCYYNLLIQLQLFIITKNLIEVVLWIR